MINRTRSRKASFPPPYINRGPCPCTLYERDPVSPDVLLNFEDSIGGVAEVMDLLEAGHEFADGTGLTYVDFPDWVAEHRWLDPRSVRRLATALSEGDRLRRELAEARTRIDGAAILLSGQGVGR